MKNGSFNDACKNEADPKMSCTRSLLLFGCFVWLLNVAMFAQTSPKETFRIETGLRFDEQDPTMDAHEQQFVVSMDDSKVREPLGEERQAQPAQYFISPDEQWIFTSYHLGSGMGSGELFKREQSLKFQSIDRKTLSDRSWEFFAKKQRELDGQESQIIDFVAWSPDSKRLLVDLRGGSRRGDGIYLWYAYFNTKTQQFELTDYLRKLNKGARDRWKNFQPRKTLASFPEAASAEPLGELSPEAELKKRAQEADQREEELHQQIMGKLDEEQKAEERDAERDWRKREPGAKFYAKSGPKATTGRRYCQYMLDSAENRMKFLESYYGYLFPEPEQAWGHFAGIWRGDTAADVKKLFGEPLPNETNAGPGLRYFDGALVVTCDKQTQRVQSVCLDLSTEAFRTQWRAASAKRHLYELQWDWSGENYESLREVFGPKLEKHSTERGETFDYAYSPRTTVSCHPDSKDGNCSAICVLWNE